MEINDIRKLSTEDINKKIKECKLELFDLKLKQATGNLDKPHQMRNLRKTVAKLKTVLNEKKEGGTK